MQKRILSLFDFSGNWSLPYAEAGAHVVQIDLKWGTDVMSLTPEWIRRNGPWHGVLAAVPCDHFAASGARWWADKDLDGRTKAGLALLEHTLSLIAAADPVFWCLENPVGRINGLCPQLAKFGPRYFQPFEHGEAYTKKTGLWGKFVMPEPSNVVEPEWFTGANGKRASFMWAKLGGQSETAKAIRSITPLGFARAFQKANP